MGSKKNAIKKKQKKSGSRSHLERGGKKKLKRRRSTTSSLFAPAFTLPFLSFMYLDFCVCVIFRHEKQKKRGKKEVVY